MIQELSLQHLAGKTSLARCLKGSGRWNSRLPLVLTSGSPAVSQDRPAGWQLWPCPVASAPAGWREKPCESMLTDAYSNPHQLAG